MADEVELIQRDLRDHAKSLTDLTLRLAGLENRLNSSESEYDVDKAVSSERRGNLDGRLDRIEESVKQVYGLGKWVLAAIGGVLITAVVGFIIRGGLFG